MELIQFRCYDDLGQFLQVLVEVFCNFLAIFVIPALAKPNGTTNTLIPI